MAQFNQRSQQVTGDQYNAGGNIHNRTSIMHKTIKNPRNFWLFGIVAIVIILVMGGVAVWPRFFGDGLKPGDVVLNYCQALVAHDFSKAASYIYQNSIDGDTPITPDQLQATLTYEEKNANGTFTGCLVSNVAIRGSSGLDPNEEVATMEVTSLYRQADSSQAGRLDVCYVYTINHHNSWRIQIGCPAL